MFDKMISNIWAVHTHRPELRFAQILAIAAAKAGWKGNDIFYCPDDILEKGLGFMAEECVK